MYVPSEGDYSELSTHDLTQRSTWIPWEGMRSMIFQLTTSRRGRQHQDLPFPPHLTFQLTTSRRGRPAAGSMVSNMSSFQLTTSRRGRRAVTDETYVLQVFQLTTSRRGRLLLRKIFSCLIILSTHDLTQRSTCLPESPLQARSSFNSRPHAEVDSELLTAFPLHRSFNSRPHAEVDQAQNTGTLRPSPFNSRPHAEVD